MSISIRPDGFVQAGKHNDCFVNVTDRALEFRHELNSASPSNTIELGNISSYKDLGEHEVANTNKVAGATFWFGALAGVLASQVAKEMVHGVLVLYKDGTSSTIDFLRSGFASFISAMNRIEQTNGTHNSQVNTTVSSAIRINENDINASLLRASMFLEDHDWNTAKAYYNAILDIDPACSQAYIGIYMAENKIATIDEFKKGFSNFSVNLDDKSIAKAIRFGYKDESFEQYKTRFQLHKQEQSLLMKAQKEREEKEKQYEKAKGLLANGDYDGAAYWFGALYNYKDSNILLSECKKKASDKHSQQQYELACELVQKETPAELERAIRLFGGNLSWRDSAQQKAIAEEKLALLNEYCKAYPKDVLDYINKQETIKSSANNKKPVYIGKLIALFILCLFDVIAWIALWDDIEAPIFNILFILLGLVGMIISGKVLVGDFKKLAEINKEKNNRLSEVKDKSLEKQKKKIPSFSEYYSKHRTVYPVLPIEENEQRTI